MDGEYLITLILKKNVDKTYGDLSILIANTIKCYNYLRFLYIEENYLNYEPELMISLSILSYKLISDYDNSNENISLKKILNILINELDSDQIPINSTLYFFARDLMTFSPSKLRGIINIIQEIELNFFIKNHNVIHDYLINVCDHLCSKIYADEYDDYDYIPDIKLDQTIVLDNILSNLPIDYFLVIKEQGPLTNKTKKVYLNIKNGNITKLFSGIASNDYFLCKNALFLNFVDSFYKDSIIILPPDWDLKKSSKNEDYYFVNEKIKKATYDYSLVGLTFNDHKDIKLKKCLC